MTQAKWINPIRQAHLVKLWNQYGNKCRLGHPNCAIESHYAFSESKLVKIVSGKDIKCFDSSGNPILDRFGNPALRHTLRINYQKVDFKVVYQSYEDDIVRNLNDYDIQSAKCIKNWSESERENTIAELRYEHELRHHNLSDRQFPVRGKFNGIAQDVYFDKQPVYKIVSIGIDGISFHSIAKVRLTCDNTILYVDIHKAMQSVSKNKRRKAIRSNKISQDVLLKIDDCIHTAVTHYLSH